MHKVIRLLSAENILFSILKPKCLLVNQEFLILPGEEFVSACYYFESFLFRWNNKKIYKLEPKLTILSQQSTCDPTVCQKGSCRKVCGLILSSDPPVLSVVCSGVWEPLWHPVLTSHLPPPGKSVCVHVWCTCADWSTRVWVLHASWSGEIRIFLPVTQTNMSPDVMKGTACMEVLLRKNRVDDQTHTSTPDPV